MAREALERAYALAPQKALVASALCPGLMTTGEEARADQLLRGRHRRGSGQHRGALRPRLHGAAKRTSRPPSLAGRPLLPLLEKGSTRHTMDGALPSTMREQQLRQRGLAVNAAALLHRKRRLHSAGGPGAGGEGGIPASHHTLAPGIQLPEDAHLFVFAVIPSGPPMPIAVKRIPGPHFPLTLSLGDGDTMMEGSRAGGPCQSCGFKARLSRGSNVMNKEGAFEGLPSPCRPVYHSTAPV